RSSWLPLPEYAQLGQGVGVLAQVLDEQGGLLHGGEVAASVELRPSHDIREVSVGQPPDRQDDVVWVDRYSQWDRQRGAARRGGGGRPGVGGLGVVVWGWACGGGGPGRL